LPYPPKVRKRLFTRCCALRANRAELTCAKGNCCEACHLVCGLNVTLTTLVHRYHIGGMASYRILSQVDGKFGVEITEPGRQPWIGASFATEREARAYIAKQQMVAGIAADWERLSPRNGRDKD
jgi:hypothetical protein